VDADDWDRHWQGLATANVANPAQDYRYRLLLTNLKLETAHRPKVLDIGSGVGEFLRVLHNRYPSIPMLGLEYSRSGVEISQRRLPQATFLQKDLVAGDSAPGEFEAFATHAVCSEVLEHVDDPVQLMRNALAYMAPGCRVVVTVPGGPRSKFDHHIGHRRHFTPGDLGEVLKQAGYDVEFAAAAGFPFFNLYRVSVILRGDRLLQDAEGTPSALLKGVGGIFRVLFKLNLPSTRFGWQTMAVARKPSVRVATTN
jgi:SAM-dependent methyltransferase